jgi:uncharacterized protein YbcI
VSARSYLFDDLLQVVMREGLTTAEHTMVRFGRAEAVRGFRQQFQDEMAPSSSPASPELATGRRVIGFASQIMFDPDIVISTFVSIATSTATSCKSKSTVTPSAASPPSAPRRGGNG